MSKGRPRYVYRTAQPSKRVHPPNYTSSMPLYPAVKRFHRDGGYKDAAIKLNQLAIFYLKSDATAAPDGIGPFIKRLAVIARIPVGASELGHVERAAAESFLVQKHLVIDDFLGNLIVEIHDYHGRDLSSWKRQERGGNVDPLNQLRLNLPGPMAIVIKTPEFALLDYFRLVRNAIVHGGDGWQRASKSHAMFTEEQLSHFRWAYNAVPSAPAALGFSDYHLYARAARCLSNLMNDGVPLTYSAIAMYLERDPGFGGKMRSRIQSSIAKRKLCLGRYVERHGSDPDRVEEFLTFMLERYPNRTT